MKPPKTKRIEDKVLYKIALKYKTKKEFYKNDPSAYVIAHKRGIIDKVCSNMPKDNKIKQKPNNYKWTNEKLYGEALKYNFISDFKKNNCSAYSIASKLGILDKICSHMKMSTNISLMEKELFDLIKSYFPSTKRLHKRKIKIKNMPYIYGFDIDIFIPELNRGIEFDGTYWHSFEHMRKQKQKKNWPDEAIKNYHKIKDKYFKNEHEIKIIHIKQKDWIKNKEKCIKRCLKFLGVKNVR